MLVIWVSHKHKWSKNWENLINKVLVYFWNVYADGGIIFRQSFWEDLEKRLLWINCVNRRLSMNPWYSLIPSINRCMLLSWLLQIMSHVITIMVLNIG